MAKCELASGRWRMKSDETRPRGCKYSISPRAPAKILPETTVRTYFSQAHNECVSYILNKYCLSLYV